MRIVYRAMHSLINARRDDAQPFPNNVIPAVMISPVAANLFTLRVCIRLQSTARCNNNAVKTTNSAFNVDQGDLKIDFKATQKRQYFVSLHQGLSKQSIYQLTGAVVEFYSSTPIYNTVGDWTRTHQEPIW